MAGLKFVTREWFSYTREPKSQHIKITRYVMVACIQAGMASTSVCKKKPADSFCPSMIWLCATKAHSPDSSAFKPVRCVWAQRCKREGGAWFWRMGCHLSVRLESAVCRCPTYIHLYITAINLGFFPVIHCETLVSLRPPEAFVLVSPPEKSFRNCY